MGFIASTAATGIGVFGQYGYQAAKYGLPPLARGTGNLIYGGAIKPAYKAGRFLWRNPGLTGGLISGAFVGYEFAKGRDLPEATARAGTEIIGLGAATLAGRMAWGTRPLLKKAGIGLLGRFGLGARAAAMGGAALGTTAAAAAWIAAPIAAYMGVRAIYDLASYRPHFSFEETYGNRRALTMRQAGLMAMSKTRRNALGREAEMMHIR